MHSQRILSLVLLFLLMAVFHPARAGVAVINGLSHEATHSPGEKTRGKIEIQNTSETPTAVKLSQADYWFSHQGESRYDEPGTNLRSNAPWISLSDLLVNLGPHEKKTIEFEVVTPAADTLSGTFWSVILVEEIAPPDTLPSRRGVSITTVTRYAVQIITHIGATGTYDLHFDQLTLTREQGVPGLNVAISNPGTRALRPEVSLELIDARGQSLGVVKADRKRIYPGTSVSFRLVLPATTPGQYTGMLVADCDEDHLYGTQVNLDL